MNILLTGGAGYVGSACLRLLKDSGHRVVAFDNLVEGHADAVDGADLVIGDIRDTSLLEKTLRDHEIEAVMHFAAATNVGESVVNPAYHYDNNVGGTLSLLNAMVAAGVKKILFSSTCATYGLNPSSPMAEDAEQDPCSPYARTKLAVEWMIRDFSHTYDMGFTLLRYFNAAGASTDGRFGEYHHPETHLIPLVLQDILDGPKALKVFGNDYATEDGTCIRDYVHIEDLASAHLLAMEAIEQNTQEVYNIGTGNGQSVLDIIKACELVSGHKVKYTIVGRRPGDAPELVADPLKLQTRLGWKPRYTKIEDTVRTAWAWHKNRPNGYAKK
ncbi:UDP-glucose 4-epimerase [Gammaproteobacteria bacterium MOLA455]|nr:UDP-glucose 4-epimerase [Gammaproteobacteria bacterium MOLA455]